MIEDAHVAARKVFKVGLGHQLSVCLGGGIGDELMLSRVQYQGGELKLFEAIAVQAQIGVGKIIDGGCGEGWMVKQTKMRCQPT